MGVKKQRTVYTVSSTSPCTFSVNLGTENEGLVGLRLKLSSDVIEIDDLIDTVYLHEGDVVDGEYEGTAILDMEGRYTAVLECEGENLCAIPYKFVGSRRGSTNIVLKV